ncbi:MAG: DUF885 domain-containing protein, partial [Pacificimonas sp.]
MSSKRWKLSTMRLPAFALLTTAAALLAGCSTSTISTTAPASQPGAEAEVAEGRDDAALNAFFDRYNDAVLARSPLTKSYRGIIDADYGLWGDFSDAAEVADYQEDQRFLSEMRDRFGNAVLSEDARLSYRLFERMMER